MRGEMAEFVNVAVDAMGGDHAPKEIVKGAVEAVNENSHVKEIGRASCRERV